MDRLFSKELLANFAGLAVAVPDREPLVLEDSKHDLVPLSSITEDVLPQTTLNLVPTVQAVPETALVEGDDVRANLSESQRVERVVEEEHLGIGAVTFAPVLAFTDECAGDCCAVDPVHLVHSHDTDRLAILGFDDKDNVASILAEAVVPTLLLFLSKWESTCNEATNLRIVDPLRKKGDVRLLCRSKVYDFPTEENNSIF